MYLFTPITDIIYYSQAQVDDDTGQITYVSPPPSSENDLRNYINGVGNHHYLLPEYVTSFLLARNLKVEFSGVKAHTARRAVQVYNDVSVSLKVKEKGFTVSRGVGVGKEFATATRTTTGLMVSIPGVQLIGYYTQVMPEFPKDQN